MTEKMKIDNFIVFFSYLMLMVAFGFSIQKFVSSHTVFEEKRLKNDAKLPEFTICPKLMDQNSNNTIESFETLPSTIRELHGINAWMGRNPTPRYLRKSKSI